MIPNRIKWIDWLKGFMMIIIILSHIGPPRIYVRFYTPVFLTIYFFLSGYTWVPRNSFVNYLKKKVTSLIVPLICLGTINALLAIVVEGDPWGERFRGLLLQRNGMWDDLWFIACLFSAQIIFYFIYRLTYKNNDAMLMALSVAISALGYLYIKCVDVALFWQLETATIMQLFFALGYIYKKHSCFDAICKLKRPMCFGFVLLACYICLVLFMDNDVNIHSERYGNFIIFIVSAVVGILVCALFAEFCEKNFPKSFDKPFNRFIVWGGQNTLVYYAFQSKAIKLLAIFFERAGLNMKNYIWSVLAAILVFILLAFPAYVIRKYFSFILGDATWFKKIRGVYQ